MSEEKYSFHKPHIDHATQIVEVPIDGTPDEQTRLAVRKINQAFIGAKLSYDELIESMQREPLAAAIKTAPKMPHPFHPDSGQERYNSWQWFQDYVGNYVLYAHSGFPDLMLAKMAPQISERIKSRKEEFDAVETLLNDAATRCESDVCRQTVRQGKTKLKAFRTQVAVLERTLDTVSVPVAEEQNERLDA